MQKNRLIKIDTFKWIAALLVAANHTSPLESLNTTADFLLTRVLARIAVPFFFMVTGYFVLNDIGRVMHSIKKTALIYLAGTILYLPVQVYKLMQTENGLQEGIAALFKTVLFDGTYYHLWYLPAVIIGLLVVTALIKYLPEQALGLTVFLYVLGLLGDSYYGVTEKIMSLKTIYDSMFTVFSYTRNGLLMAPIFLVLGWEIAKKRRSFSDDNVLAQKEAYYKLGIFLFALVFMSIEALLLQKNDMQRHDSMYLFLPICMWYLFSYLVSVKAASNREMHSFYYEGPMVFYVIHPFAILVVRAIVKITNIRILVTVSPLYYLAVVSCGLCGTYLVLLGKKYVKNI